MNQPQQAPGQAQQPAAHKFGALAWTSVILGIIGVVGSPIIFLNNLTAVAAAVGVVLGVIALFGTRKVLAAIGVALCIAGITFTVLAQGAAAKDFDERFGGGGEPGAGLEDITVSDCSVTESAYGVTRAEAVVNITNSTDKTQSYLVTISVNDDTGARVGVIHVSSSSLAAGQSVTLSGMDASGMVNEGAQPGPARCVVADVDRFAS